MGSPTSVDVFTERAGQRLILSGAAALSRGAFEAGVGLVVTYPGSPVVETFDVFAAGAPAVDAQVVINEHVAYHKAMGYAFAGGRSLVIVKHVGLNVAADPAHYSGYTGVRGGMVVIVGSDPGANCSTGEFDCRLYSLHSHLPVFEPGDFQEALEVTRTAFDISEELALPAMVFVPSKFCYAMGTVVTGERVKPRRSLSFAATPDLTNVGSRAVARHRILLEKVARLANEDVPAVPRPIEHRGSGDTLVLTAGIHRDMVLEALTDLDLLDEVSVYSPRLTYPLARPSLQAAIEKSNCRRIVVVEDLESFLELQLSQLLVANGWPIQVLGKELFPAYGPLDYTAVSRGLAEACHVEPSAHESRAAGSLAAVHREGTFCPGCPHRAFFDTLLDVLDDDAIIGGDIGCSSLPPHYSDWLTCMNSGPSIAAGVTLALGASNEQQRVVSVIGDSTLFHSGLQTVIDCAQRDSRQVCFILDNSWTAMTGHQQTPGTARDVSGERQAKAVDIVGLLRACGVSPVMRADPVQVPQMRRTIMQALAQSGFVCVVVERECKLQENRRPSDEPWHTHYAIIEERCRKCNRCYSVLTCPAIGKNDADDLVIDPQVCTSCSMCRQVCPNGAIVAVGTRCLPTGEEQE